jgi:hypothetical protein
LKADSIGLEISTAGAASEPANTILKMEHRNCNLKRFKPGFGADLSKVFAGLSSTAALAGSAAGSDLKAK